MTFLSGKKSWIVAIVVAIAGLVNLITGQDFTGWTRDFFISIGWGDELGSELSEMLGTIAVTGFAAWASIDRLLKYRREKKAGASTSEALTPVGGVKLAIAEGVIPPVRIVPPSVAEPPSPKALREVKALNADVSKKAEV